MLSKQALQSRDPVKDDGFEANPKEAERPIGVLFLKQDTGIYGSLLILELCLKNDFLKNCTLEV